MKTGRCNRFVTATLLLAALTVYVDAPRLHLVTSLGDTLNAVRVLDPIQHTLMQLRLDAAPEGSELVELGAQLADGRESLELLAHTGLLQAVLPWRIEFRTLLKAPAAHESLAALAVPFPAALPLLVQTLDLPPPRFEALFKPPRLEAPALHFTPHGARAPPLGW